ncbi:MAG: hypothetical protein J6Z43_08940 [Clostridiales bacterium]|nr:hypothetical protein [Clostridiales bacterium]
MNNNDVKLRAVQCPSCGGAIEFPVGRNKATCTFCGNEVLVDEAGWLGKLDEFELKMKNAECALENKEWEHARQLFEACKMINETDPRCYRGIIESRTRGLTAGFNEKTESLYHCYINRIGAGADPVFVERYTEYLRRVADNDTATAASHAKENIEYFQRVIEAKHERIADQKNVITDIKARPSEESAEKRYISAKSGLAFSTIMLVLAPVITLGLAILAVVLLVKSITGDVHIAGMIASVVGTLIFAGVTKFVWKHYRGTIDRVKRRRVSKLQEDHINSERDKDKARQIDYRNSEIDQAAKDITSLEQSIAEQNEYLAIDRPLRIAYFEKIHFDAAGIANDITVDPSILRFCELERSTKPLPGYKTLTKTKV